MLSQKPYRRLTAARLRLGRHYESASKDLQDQYLASRIALPSMEAATLPSGDARLDKQPERGHWQAFAYTQAQQAASVKQEFHMQEDPVLKVLRAQCSKQALLELKMAMTPSKLPQLQLEAIPTQSSDGPSITCPMMPLDMLEVPILIDAMQASGLAMHNSP